MMIFLWYFSRHLSDFFFFLSVIIRLIVIEKHIIDTILGGESLCSVKVVRQFREAGFMTDLNEDQGATLNKKIRSAQLAQYNYIFGKDE